MKRPITILLLMFVALAAAPACSKKKSELLQSKIDAIEGRALCGLRTPDLRMSPKGNYYQLLYSPYKALVYDLDKFYRASLDLSKFKRSQMVWEV